MTDIPRCKTCKHWSVTDPYWLANIDSEHAWGHCCALKASSNFEADVEGDSWIRGYDTTATFGCAEHEAEP